MEGGSETREKEGGKWVGEKGEGGREGGREGGWQTPCD